MTGVDEEKKWRASDEIFPEGKKQSSMGFSQSEDNKGTTDDEIRSNNEPESFSSESTKLGPITGRLGDRPVVPIISKPKLWNSKRNLRCLPRQSSLPRRSSINNGSMVCVEKWLQEKPRSIRSLSEEQSFDETKGPENRPNKSKGTEKKESYPSDSDCEPSRSESLTTDAYVEAIELLREEHQVLKEIEEEHVNVYADLEEAKKKCGHLEKENAILRERLIRMNHEYSELETQLDSIDDRASTKPPAIEKSTSGPEEAPDDHNGETSQPKHTGSSSTSPAYLRTLFRRSKSAWSVDGDNPMDPLSDVNRKNSLINWFDSHIPSLEQEVGDEAARIKALLTSIQSDVRRLPVDHESRRAKSMRNLMA